MGILDGRTAIVTGATRGIGRAIAAALVAEGATVGVNGRTAEACEEAAGAMGGLAYAAPGDIGQPGVPQQLVADLLARAGRIDIVVNNAGVALDNFVTGITDERWDRTLATNLTGPMKLIRAAVRPMKAQEGGAILNVSSWAGIRGNVGQAAYSASKAGIYGLTLTAAKELGRFGIRVNALGPMASTGIGGDDVPAENQAELDARRCLNVKGTVDDVAEAALFMVSDRSRFITGQMLNVDGGLHLT
jgi:3-oxoacyl-[acyl-carrier protein] reductase